MIETKTHGYVGSTAFADVSKYVRRDAAIMSEGMEPVLALGCAHVTSPETWALEAATAYELSSARKHTLTHRTISWEPKLVVSAEEAQAAFERLTAALGMHDQMALWSLQNDSFDDSAERIYHIHVLYAGVNPSTLRADHSRYNDYATVGDMLRQMEIDYGWASGAKGAAAAVQAAEEIVIGARVEVKAAQILERLTQYQAHFSRQHLTVAIHAAGVKNYKQQQDIRKKVLLLAKQIGPDAWTSHKVWEAEERVTKALDGLGTGFCGLTGAKPRKGLTDEQVHAFEYALETGARRKLITGVAGSGKSYVVRDVAAAFEAAGYDVRAVSNTHSACMALEKQTGIPTRTIASELWRQDNRDDSQLTKNDVIIIDEISQLGTMDAAELLEAADRSGSIVIGFGDHKQFGSVGHGNVLGEWMRLDPGVDLAKTVRQNEEWMRTATEDMRAGRVAEAIGAYRDHQMIHRHRTQRGARAKLVDRWKHYESSGYEVSVHTYSNRERIKLAQQVRAAHRELGGLTSSDVYLNVRDGRLPFATGDRVTVRGNLPELGLRNGMAAVVVGIHGTTLQVEREGVVVDIDTTAGPDHAAIEHGYVATTYREMGATRQVSLSMLGRYENSASFNVGFSRHTDAFEAFFSHEHCGTYEHMVEMASHDRVKYSAHEIETIENDKHRARVQAEIDKRDREHERQVMAAAEKLIAEQMERNPSAYKTMEEKYDPETLARHRRNVAVAEKMIVPLAGTPGEDYLRTRGLAKSGYNIPANVHYCANWAQGFETNSVDRKGRPKVSPGHGPAVVFPMYDYARRVIAYQGRFINPPVFGKDRAVKVWTVGPANEAVYVTPGAWDAPVVAASEGGPDALAMYAMGMETVAKMGTGTHVDWLPDALEQKEVVIASDPDIAGEKMATELSRALSARSSTTRLKFPDDIPIPADKKMDVAFAFEQAPEKMQAEVTLAKRRVFDPLQRAWTKLHDGRWAGKARDMQLYRELGTLEANEAETLAKAEAQARRDVGLPPLESVQRNARGRRR